MAPPTSHPGKGEDAEERTPDEQQQLSAVDVGRTDPGRSIRGSFCLTTRAVLEGTGCGDAGPPTHGEQLAKVIIC